MELENFLVEPGISVLNAMDAINTNGRGIVYVRTDDRRLLGSVTDGNIRRYILKNGNLSAAVTAVMNENPKTLSVRESNSAASFMRENGITSVPILDKQGKIISIEFLHAQPVRELKKLDVPVVIMAGGKGTRLYPYTQVLPKPLIPVGEKTIIELIMERFENFGCNRFNVIVNYKRNIIKSFFMDSEHRHSVEFTDEDNFLGTGGGLKLLTGKYSGTFFMTNCDVLLDEDYAEILDYHKKHRNIITMVCAMKHVTIPYGTVELNADGSVGSMREKPSFSFLTNTGIYLIEPEFLDYIPEGEFIHITDVIDKCIADGKSVGAYPVGERAWMDMGELGEMEKMKKRLEADG